jgi:type I restriction enzyme M protein
MREKEPGNSFVLGIYYDEGRIFLFKRDNGKFLRFDDHKNTKGLLSGSTDLSLHLPDPYRFIPTLNDLEQLTTPPEADLAARSVADLDVITSIHTLHVRDALSNVLRVLDKAGLTNQRGYEILVQTLALKIFDEKRNERQPKVPLRFFGHPDELHFGKLADKTAQDFIKRIDGIRQDALSEYGQILRHFAVDWKNIEHVRVVAAVCENFQDFSFVRSSKSDLYQLVFYNFANRFQQQEKAQFLTPLAVIDFLVEIVAPHGAETVFDPCCGIGDFLSLAFVNSQSLPGDQQLNDANIFGADVSEDMITLASLNMLLNGDGNARLFRVPDLGSIVWKPAAGNPPEVVELLPDHHQAGQWEEWPDETTLFKFDVILTNPPFGEDRSFRPRTDIERRVLEMYETWGLVSGESMDLGVLFLENAFRSLKEGGRLGIVLSNSIASTSKFRPVRDWLLERTRLVAVFDLPPNVFAETGVNTTLVVAYRPSATGLKRLNRDGYSVFVKDIRRVGYERRTSKRNVVFSPLYRLDPTTFEIATDSDGNPVLDEDFTATIHDFRAWAAGQEKRLKDLFLP